MKLCSVRSLVACFLAMTIVLSGAPLRALASDAMHPESTLPEETLTEPSATETAASDPSETEAALPEEETTEPEGTTAETTVTSDPQPEISGPEEPEMSASATEEPAPTEPLTEAPASEQEQPIPAAICEPEASAAGPGLYFGLLGGHSDLSEGSGSVEALFRSAAGMAGLDFFAAADHSDSLDNHASADIRTDASGISADWAAGKAAAAAVTSPSFVGIFGYEMNWPSQMKLGHISTFGTPGFQSREQEPYRNYAGALENYYAVLASAPGGVSQFEHPGTQYGDFNGFQPYSAEADRTISLLKLDFGARNLLRYYVKALDRGWHLAPTAGQSVFSTRWTDDGIRTAVYAQSLTEEGILDGLRSCRAYATEDSDLEILYSMDGCPMGSRLGPGQTGERADLSVIIQDPTDGSACTVEVITTGGQTVAKETLTGASGTLSLSIPPTPGYYFLLVTQPDGQRAVTAPIWIEAEEELGIADVTCDTAVPVQNEAVTLTAALYNGEPSDFLVESLEILADGTLVATDRTLSVIGAGSTLSHALTFTCGCAGSTEITVRLTGTLAESRRSYEASLQLNFRQPEQVTNAAAGNTPQRGTMSLDILSSMAAEEHIRFQAAESGADDFPADCRFLLVTAPAQPFSEEFLASVKAYADSGGSIVLCGQAEDPSGNEELNRLLLAIGSTVRLTDRPVTDPENNNGDPEMINTDRFNRSLIWCEAISENQVYRVCSACAVDSGQGQWMVKARPTSGTGEDVLLACEDLSGGGTVFVGGSLFLADENLEKPGYLWEESYANRTIAQMLLRIDGEAIPLSTVAQAREGEDGQLMRIRGYVTAGTSNPRNSFPGVLYLQDDTGGIAIMPFSEGNIQPGTPVEITGYAGTRDGNRILKMGSWKILEGALYQYPPREGNWERILDMAENGGRLVQVEGICREIYCREDDILSGCLLEDDRGNTAVILVEAHIGDSAGGENDLHKTIRSYRTVRATGLLHTDEYGNTVIRVRNCDEVVWVPPRYYWNPRTGDFLLPGCCTAMTLSALGLVLLKKRKKP